MCAGYGLDGMRKLCFMVARDGHEAVLGPDILLGSDLVSMSPYSAYACTAHIISLCFCSCRISHFCKRVQHCSQER
jgi:hypothetical protein